MMVNYDKLAGMVEDSHCPQSSKVTDNGMRSKAMRSNRGMLGVWAARRGDLLSRRSFVCRKQLWFLFRSPKQILGWIRWSRIFGGLLMLNGLI